MGNRSKIKKDLINIKSFKDLNHIFWDNKKIYKKH